MVSMARRLATIPKTILLIGLPTPVEDESGWNGVAGVAATGTLDRLDMFDAGERMVPVIGAMRRIDFEELES